MKFTSQRALHSPWVDFLLIGGLSIIALPVCLLLPTKGPEFEQVLAIIWGLQFVINYPHFAFSYQILYSRLSAKLKNENFSLIYKIRIIFAALIVPVILIALLAYGAYNENSEFLGYMVNAMFFFVGWHYVKQGYGILMVISAANKYYYNKAEKNFLLINSYIVWMFGWLLGNSEIGKREMWGLYYKNIDIPEEVTGIFITLTIIMFLLLIANYIRIKREGRKPPTNAIMGYLTTLYLWIALVTIHPLYLAIVPFFHSLQYIFFVYKYKKEEYKTKVFEKAIFRLVCFAFIGIVLGALGFFFLPYLLDNYMVNYSPNLGPTFFVFAFVIFINIHHYFIDNVIWRRENKVVHEYLLKNT